MINILIQYMYIKYMMINLAAHIIKHKKSIIIIHIKVIVSESFFLCT
jgi:hypothetical protein